jgi:hypothetical protein
MYEFDRALLKGFCDPVRVSALRTTWCSTLPEARGVYVVLWPHNAHPEFLDQNLAGRWKGKSPTEDPAELKRRWVSGARVLYIGKAGMKEPDGEATLLSRVGLLLRFAYGAPVPHWGGRYLWQIADWEQLRLAWRETPRDADPEDAESKMLGAFAEEFGRLPFANLRSPRRHE